MGSVGSLRAAPGLLLPFASSLCRLWGLSGPTLTLSGPTLTLSPPSPLAVRLLPADPLLPDHAQVPRGEDPAGAALPVRRPPASPAQETLGDQMAGAGEVLLTPPPHSPPASPVRGEHESRCLTFCTSASLLAPIPLGRGRIPALASARSCPLHRARRCAARLLHARALHAYGDEPQMCPPPPHPHSPM